MQALVPAVFSGPSFTAISINNNNDSLIADIIKKNQNMNDKIEALQAKIDQISTLAATILVAKAPIIIPILETPRSYAPADQISLTPIIKNNTGIIINSFTVQEKIELRTRASTRASSQAADSTHIALRLTVTAPAIETPVLMRPEQYLTIPNIEGSSTTMEHILPATIITVLESPQQLLETMIEVPVRTTTSLYDITPSNKSDHALEAISLDGKPNVDADEYNDINDQHTNSTHQQGQSCSNFNSDNSNCTSSQVPSDNFRRIDIDVSYESKQVDPNNFNNQYATVKVIETIYYCSQYTGKARDEATLYSDCGTLHTPIPMVLIY